METEPKPKKQNMRKEKIEVKTIEIRRTEFTVEVPTFSKRRLENFVARNLALMDETDQWILRNILSQGIQVESSFIVCFRSPADFGLSNRLFSRVWDFNSALLGETLSPWQVVNLCFALSQLSKRGPHSALRCCGSMFHVMSTYEEAGKHQRALQISSNSEAPILGLESPSRGALYFNPTSYYGVALRA